MRHIHFLSDNKSLCEVPRRMGYDFVVQSTTDTNEPSCKVCSDLLFNWNLREYERESRSSVMYLPPTQSDDGDDLGRGVLFGLAISTIFWLVLFLVLNLKGVI